MRNPGLMCPAILLAALLAWAPPPLARAGTASTASTASVQIASSAMLVMDASVHKHDIVLHISRTASHTPIEGAGNVTATIGGHAVPITVHGTAYVLSTRDLKGGARTLRVIVAHDGIHELLSGTVTLAKPPARLALLERHGYGAWWVLNIVVLLLAANLIMRRKKKPPAKPR